MLQPTSLQTVDNSSLCTGVPQQKISRDYITTVKAIAHLTLLLAVFIHVLAVHSLAWLILWLEEEKKELALLLPLFAQKLLLYSLNWFILWVVLENGLKKLIANAAGARLVPRNTPIAIAPIAIRLTCLIIVRYCISLYKKPNVASHLWYLSSSLNKTAILC